jgi:hypothetical protein
VISAMANQESPMAALALSEQVSEGRRLKLFEVREQERAEWIRAENAEAERDSLREETARLRAALTQIANWPHVATSLKAIANDALARKRP